MGKTRVHLLAKELGIETKDLIAQLDKLGIRGRKAQSSLEDDEVARLRAALAGQEKPQVHVGEEKVVADRVVTAENENLGEIQARETIVERRVRANVIRRRTSRVEVVSQATEKPQGEVEPRPAEAPVAAVETASQVPTAEELPGPAPEIEVPEQLAGDIEAIFQEEPIPADDIAAGAMPRAVPAQEEPILKATPEAKPTIQEEAPRGARVLGRIDLRRTMRVEPAPTPVARRPMPGAPAVSPAPGAEALKPGEAAKPQGAEGDKPVKAGRHKKRIVKKQDVLEFREKELRSGRIPRKKRALPGKEQRKTEITVPRASKRIIKISEVITVGDLARDMGVKAGEVIKKLMGLGMMATINQVLDADTATLIASEFDHQVENVAFDADSALEVEHQVEEQETALTPRSPVVTIMGHVDHGKTSLLDAIRSTHVTAQEHGGITQHIGAYHVQVDGRSVTFLDTPGHEAFTAMRARGAQVTDIVVLVVAADDAIMPQTIEAISHAKNAGVPLVVAINKIDLPTANVQKVKQDLLSHGVVLEEFGGTTLMTPISAKKGTNVDALLDQILLQAELLDLKANPERKAHGTVLEAQLDPGKGALATILVQNGTLRVGDDFICGQYSGRVRAMYDERGGTEADAGPSTPVQILGFEGVPEAGDSFLAMDDAAEARDIAQKRQRLEREAQHRRSGRVKTLEDFMAEAAAGGVATLRIIIKADQGGPAEALADALAQLSTAEVKVEVVHRGVGAITESDVLLARASGAIIVGFHVRPDSNARAAADRERVEIRTYRIIYEAVEEVKLAMEGLLAPEKKEVVLGEAFHRQLH